MDDPASKDAQRKALLRCLVEKVVLDRGEHDVALARIVWRGGSVTNLEVKLKVNSAAKLTRGVEMRDRVLDLVHEGTPDDKIAAVLTAEGHRSSNCQTEVLTTAVQQIRRDAGLKAAEPHRRWLHDASLLSPPELAARLKAHSDVADNRT